MNGLNKLKNNKKTIDNKSIDNKSIIKICDSDDDKSVGSDKKCSDKIVDKSDGETKKNLGGRPKKAILYKTERLTLFNKLNNILGITKDNKIFYIYDIKNNNNKQKEINDLVDDVKIYFKGKSNAIFTSDDIDKKWLSIIKIIYKEMNFKLIHSYKLITRNDKKIKSGYYTLIDQTT